MPGLAVNALLRRNRGRTQLRPNLPSTLMRHFKSAISYPELDLTGEGNETPKKTPPIKIIEVETQLNQIQKNQLITTPAIPSEMGI